MEMGEEGEWQVEVCWHDDVVEGKAAHPTRAVAAAVDAIAGTAHAMASSAIAIAR